jgi:Ca2+-binding RTX toxin-like protein
MASPFYRPRSRSMARWRAFRPVLERLEDRTAPAIGGLLQTFQHTPATNEGFGAAVAAVGSNILVGAPGVTVSGHEAAGAAYLLNGTTGAVLRIFTNPTPLANEQFGFSVAAVGSNVLIGAPFATLDGHFSAGEAYLYDGSTGVLLHTFNRGGAAADDDHFGYSVGSAAGNALVGAPGLTVSGHFGAGAAYRFNSTTFALLSSYNNPDPGDHENFGFAVAGHLTNVLIGAPFANVGAVPNAGSAYLFNITGSIFQTLTSPTPTTGNGFGKAVAGGFSILVGDPHVGAVFQFDGNGTVINTFQDPNPTPGSFFGNAIASLPKEVLVGAPFASVGALTAGAAYLFDGDTTGLLQTFVNPDIDADDTFGFAVAAVGTSILIGAPGESSSAAFAGKAYTFDFNARGFAAPKDGLSDVVTVYATFSELRIALNGQDVKGLSLGSAQPLLIVGADGEELTLEVEGEVFIPPGSEFRAGNGSGDVLRVVDFDTSVNLTDSKLESLHFGSASLSGFEFADVIAEDISSDVAYIASGFTGRLGLRGGSGNDLLVGGPNFGFISGNNGNDTLLGGAGGDELDGGDGDDLLLGEDGNDFLIGSTGNDTLVGGAGEDRATFGLEPGQNTAILRNDGLTMATVATQALSGIEVVFLTGTSGSDFLDARGFTGRVFLQGFQGNDTLLGGNGNDTLNGDLGNDSLNGGPGSDQLQEVGPSGAVTLTLSNTQLTGTLGVDRLAGLEAAHFNMNAAASAKLNAAAFTLGPVTMLGSSGNDTLTGGGKSDTLDGRAGNDKLDGRQGNDSLTAGAGNDTAIGGPGLDRFLKDYRSSSGLSWALINTRLTVTGSISSVDQLNGVELAFLLGSDAGADTMNAAAFTLGSVTLDGGGGNDTLTGGGKNDLLIGGNGDDSLAGGNGNDTFIGGNGDDNLNGGNGTDRVSAFGAGNFTLTDAGLTVTGPLGSDTFTGAMEQAALTGDGSNQTLDASAFSGRVTLLGGAGNDCLFGGAGNDSLQGGDGNDFLDGKGGNDTLSGNNGQDSLNGGGGTDRMVEILTGSSNLTNTFLFNSGVFMEALASIEQASLTGSGLGEFIDASAFTLGPVTLDGGGGNDLLRGGAGNDLLLGGESNDTLDGGGGVDIANGGIGFDTAINAEIRISIP